MTVSLSDLPEGLQVQVNGNDLFAVYEAALDIQDLLTGNKLDDVGNDW